jgi:hypothetical protein
MIQRMIYEFTLLADMVEKIDIFCDENILYSGTDSEDIKTEVKKLPNTFNRCKIVVPLLDNKLFVNLDNKRLEITFLLDNNYPFSFLQVLYSNFLNKIEFDDKIKKNFAYLMNENGFDINKNPDTIAKKEIYYFHHKINSFINDYYKNWSPADRLFNFTNNLLLMINDLANKITNLDLTEYNEEIPDELIDKVFTMTIYNDPVVAIDGFTYERASITKWFSGSNKSPMTGQVLETLKLYSNNEMKSRCIEWKEKHKKL